MLCQSRLHAASETFVRRKKLFFFFNGPGLIFSIFVSVACILIGKDAGNEKLKKPLVLISAFSHHTAVPHLNQSVGNVHPEPQNHSPKNPHPPLDPPPLAPLHPQGQPNLTSPSRRGPSLQASAPQPLARPKEPPPKLPVWERIHSEEFHQSVLQSTQTSQQKQKGDDGSLYCHIWEIQPETFCLAFFCVCIPTGGASEQFEPPVLPPAGVPRALNRLPNGQSNGHPCHISAQRESPDVRNDLSAEEGVSSGEDEEEESFVPRWKGIESIFEAYEGYMEGTLMDLNGHYLDRNGTWWTLVKLFQTCISFWLLLSTK